MAAYREFFNDEELLEIVRELLRRKSDYPNHTEEAAARYVHDLLMEHGIKAELQYVARGRPNVLAVLEGDSAGPTMIYNGHLDVVPPGEGWTNNPFDPVVRNRKLYGRGAADMKSGVAAMIYAAIVLQRMGCRFSGRLFLLFNVDEERENAGMHHFLKQDVTADYAVISEPTDLAICVAHKGIARYRLRTKGVAQHAGLVRNHVQNAVVAMGQIIQALAELGKRVQQKHDALLGTPSLTITKISGGTAINIVPDSCEIEIDRRLLPGETAEEVLQEIDAACARCGVHYEIDNYLFLPATKVEKNHVLVEQLKIVSDAHGGKTTPVTVFEAACEAPFFSVHKGIPTIIFGPGSLKQAHVSDEYVVVEQVLEAAKIFVKLALQLLKE